MDAIRFPNSESKMLSCHRSCQIMIDINYVFSFISSSGLISRHFTAKLQYTLVARHSAFSSYIRAANSSCNCCSLDYRPTCQRKKPPKCLHAPHSSPGSAIAAHSVAKVVGHNRVQPTRQRHRTHTRRNGACGVNGKYWPLPILVMLTIFVTTRFCLAQRLVLHKPQLAGHR